MPGDFKDSPGNSVFESIKFRCYLSVFGGAWI